MRAERLVLCTLVVFLAVAAAPCAVWAEGGIVFGEPVVVEPELGPVPVGDFRNANPSPFHFLTQSDNYVLLLVGTPVPGVWSMVRMRHTGELVDTIPRQMRGLNYQHLGATFALTWEAPYFYLWEGDGESVFYTRLTEELTLVDQLPRRLAETGSAMSFGGSQYWHGWVWHNGLIYGYDARTDSALVDGVGIPSWTQIGGDNTKGVVHNGYYLIRSNPVDSTIQCAYISESGDVQVLAPGYLHPYPFHADHYSGDTVVFCRVDDHKSPPQLLYFFLSPSDSALSAQLHRADIPRGRYGVSDAVFTGDHKAIVFGCPTYGAYGWFAQTIDLASGEVTSTNELPFAVGAVRAVFTPEACVAAAQSMNGVRAITLPGPDYTSVENRGPVLYGLGHESQPTVAVDSAGITVYTMQGFDGGTRLNYRRWQEWSAVDLSQPVSGVPIPADSDVCAPTLLDIGDARWLYWLDRLVDSTGMPTALYQQRVAPVEGDMLSTVVSASALVLDTTVYAGYYEPRHLPPDGVRIGDSVYIISNNGGEEWYVRAISLQSGAINAWGPMPARSIAPPQLFNHADSLVRWGVFYMCLEDCGNIGCCVFSRYTYGRHYFHGALTDDWSSGLPGIIEPEWPDPVRGSHHLRIGGEDYIALTEWPSIQQVDLSDHATTMVADLSGLLSAPMEFEEGLEVLLGASGNYRVAVALRSDRHPHDAFVFDSQWNLVGRSGIPTVGCVADPGDLVPIPGTDTLLLVYSAWLPYPYSSERLIVQKVWLDPATAVDPEDPALPGSFAVEQNYPNPFNAGTVIQFNLPERGKVTVEVFNILGQVARRWGPTEYGPGEHTIEWNGRADDGSEAATGVYLYRVSTDQGIEVRKMLLLK